jgi:hypothetical protein
MGKPDTPENRVKTEVLKYLKLRQIKAWSNPSGAGGSLMRRCGKRGIVA